MGLEASELGLETLVAVVALYLLSLFFPCSELESCSCCKESIFDGCVPVSRLVIIPIAFYSDCSAEFLSS